MRRVAFFLRKIVFISSLTFCGVLAAHSGGLDSAGGHHNRSTGTYHCHSQSCLLNEENQDRGRYTRSDWIHWDDKDNDCQNLRAELLIFTSSTQVIFRSDKNCVIDSGSWSGSYSNKRYYYASDLDIDHVIPLEYAHKTGGADWLKARKRQFANDLRNLVVVSSEENRRKGSKGPSGYLPLDAFQCTYAAKWLEVSEAYSLKVTEPDRSVIFRIIKGCP